MEGRAMAFTISHLRLGQSLLHNAAAPVLVPAAVPALPGVEVEAVGAPGGEVEAVGGTCLRLHKGATGKEAKVEGVGTPEDTDKEEVVGAAEGELGGYMQGKTLFRLACKR